MTEVPDKQTEGTGRRAWPRSGPRTRSRGRAGRRDEPGRGRTRCAAEPVAAVPRRWRARPIALPGERLSPCPGERGSARRPGRRPGSLSEADLASAEVFTLDDLDDEATGRRSTRRPAGRTAIRGRRGAASPSTSWWPRSRSWPRSWQDGEAGAEAEAAAEAGSAPVEPRPPPGSPGTSPGRWQDERGRRARPRRADPRTTPFGSVWDSQLGTPAPRRGAPRAPLVDDEDFEEPEIPEYLIAEQRRGGNRGGGGGGGPRGSWRSIGLPVGDGSRALRPWRGGGGGINRYPDVSGRTAVERAAARGPALQPRR